MEKYFFLNVQFALVPLIIAFVLFFVSLAKKYYRKNIFIETSDKIEMVNFVELRKSS